MTCERDKGELYQGDCLEVLPTLAAGSVDFVVADLPYGQTHNKWDSCIDLGRLWPELLRVAKENAAVVLFAQGMFTVRLMQSQPRLWRYNLIWDKNTPTGFLNAKRMPLRVHEDICVFYRKLPTYNPQKTSGHGRKTTRRKGTNTTNYGRAEAPSSYDSTERYPTSILEFSPDRKGEFARVHPTQKPLDLLRWLVRTYSNPGDVVLDCCMGSGTAGEAALLEGRRFVGVELDGTYFELAKRRIEGVGEKGEDPPGEEKGVETQPREEKGVEGQAQPGKEKSSGAR